tara:strand:+ start:106 stop:552 length:447 start_codon:yes stop_codon:yes gene_type:complete
MNKSQVIGWQKYEDIIESNVNSPLIDMIYQSMSKVIDFGSQEDEALDTADEQFASHQEAQLPVMLNFDETLASEIALANTFDCWIGHTNFNVTEKVKNELDSIDGVEMLKVFSRYRFLIGVGRMFNFADVRKNIENTLSVEKGENFEN